jgi:hypothetical protein
MPLPETTLSGMLVDDLSRAQASTFLKQYVHRTAIIYKEADSRSFKDDDVHEAYKAYHYGQTRFTLHQSMFLKLAEDCGLEWEIDRCPQNGFPSAVVKVGRFFFTDHYGATPQEITCLNASLMRKQSAEINVSYIQGSLFEPAFDETKLLKAQSIYANIIHGCRGMGGDFALYGFARIAIPSVTKAESKKDVEKQLRFVEQYDLNDVLASVVERERQGIVAQPVIDVAIPKIKVSKLTNQGGNQKQ